MNKYFSTFIPGLGHVVRTALKSQIKDSSEVLLFDGLIVYQSSSTPKEISRLRFLNNSFLLIRIYGGLGKSPMEDMAEIFLRDAGSTRQTFPEVSAKSFRVVFSRENDLVSIDNNLQRKVEEKLSGLFEMSVDRASPGVEFWFLYRREGHGFLGLRLTRHPDYKDILQKGELRPELADLLCLISEPNSLDVFLDPFAGSGAISIERSKVFPYKKIIAGDIDGSLVSKLVERAKNLQDFAVARVDGLGMRGIADGLVDKIVTDPPWAVDVGKNLDIEDFYRKMLREFVRIARDGGIIVLLSSQKEVVLELLSEFASELGLLAQYDILVSGKKAGVFKIGVGRSYLR